MSYRLITIDLDEPPSQLTLAPGDDGVGIIVRRRGRLIGFEIIARPDLERGVFTSVDAALGSGAARAVLVDRLREEASPPGDPTPRLPWTTIAICTRNRTDTLARCLESLGRLEGTDELAEGLDVLVIDNAPPDDRTRRLVERFPVARYVLEPKPGLNFARNAALREARGDLLSFIDDDVVVDPGWLRGLREAWLENPDAGCFTGLVLPFALDTEAQLLFELRGGFRRGFDKIRFGPERASQSIYPCGAGMFGAGANMTLRRDLVRSLGGFDEALDTGRPLPGGGDLDIFLRVLRAGYPLVYEPQYAVFHEHRKDLPGLKYQYWTWGLAHMAFVVKTYGSDPAVRGRLRRLVRWWFSDMTKQIVQSLRGRHPLPPGMLWAELSGGVVGLLGEYGRSQRRVDERRRVSP